MNTQAQNKTRWIGMIILIGYGLSATVQADESAGTVINGEVERACNAEPGGYCDQRNITIQIQLPPPDRLFTAVHSQTEYNDGW